MTIREQIDELFGPENELAASPNTYELLKAAAVAGLVRAKPNGAMKLWEPAQSESVKVLGRDLPFLGTLYPVYERRRGPDAGP